MPDLKLQCNNCKSREYYCQDGLYFCEECNVQYENLVEMEHEEHNALLTTKYRVRFSKKKSQQKDNLKARRLTSWEEYNHILIGFVDEILSFKTIPNFKVTCLQLWIAYLQATEAAFFEKDRIAQPKLFALYRQSDAEILYNKPPIIRKKKVRQRKSVMIDDPDSQRQRRKRMRKSEKLISKQLNESMHSESMNSSVTLANLSIDTIMSEHEDAEMDIEFSQAGSKALSQGHQTDDEGNVKERKLRTRDVTSNDKGKMLNGTLLLSIIYSALNICGSDIQLSDLVRLVREGHLSFYRCKQFLPDDIIEQGVPIGFEEYHSYLMIHYEKLREHATSFTKFIPDLRSSIKLPNLIELSKRYLDEMNLPEDLAIYIERLMIFLPPIMNYNTLLPNYEGRAMAYIIFVLKLIFGTDGYREREMSESARKINARLKDADLQKQIFVYEDWRNHIEYRQVILENFYHPTIFKHDYAGDKPYLAFNSMLDAINPKTKRTDSKIPRGNAPRLNKKMELQSRLAKLIKKHKDQQKMTPFHFHFSMTPLKDAFQHILLSNVRLDIERDIASQDFSASSCESYLQPEKLKNTLSTIGIDIDIKKSTFPKSFVFTESLKQFKYKRSTVAMTHDMNEAQWRADLKLRQSLERAAVEKAKQDYHKKQLELVLAKRLKWRKKIRDTKLSRKRQTSKVTTVNESNEPETLSESRILSDSEDGEVCDINVDEIAAKDSPVDELDKIFQSYNRMHSADDNKLTFITPDYNTWKRKFFIDKRRRQSEKSIESLPKSFTWLLQNAAGILHQHPLTLYEQVLVIELQFMDIYEPIEMMENVLVRKTPGTLKGCDSQKKLDDRW